jgi:hypothetical protein
MSDGEAQTKPFTWERGPFVTCPKCQTRESFGILAAGGDVLRKRCFKCRYAHNEILPELDKRVIYLDQFAFSELHKIRDGSRREDKHTAFWTELSHLINEAVLLQQIILPHSNIHHDETIVSPFAKELRNTQEHIGGDISFVSTDEIQFTQIEAFAEAFVTGVEPNLNFDVDDILDDDRNKWLEDMRISVPFDWSSFAPETRARRTKTGEAISSLIDRWVAKSMSFDEVLDQELNSYHQSRIEALREEQRRFEEGLAKLDMMALANFAQSPAFREHQFVRGLLTESGVSEDLLTAKIHEFWSWERHKEQPYGKILAYLFASLAAQFANGRKNKPSAGLMNDISVISTYAPYVDAMFIDNECAELLRHKRCKAELSYRANIFCLNSDNEFIAYLKSIISNTPVDVRNYASIIYGI